MGLPAVGAPGSLLVHGHKARLSDFFFNFFYCFRMCSNVWTSCAWFSLFHHKKADCEQQVRRTNRQKSRNDERRLKHTMQKIYILSLALKLESEYSLIFVFCHSIFLSRLNHFWNIGLVAFFSKWKVSFGKSLGWDICCLPSQSLNIFFK